MSTRPRYQLTKSAQLDVERLTDYLLAEASDDVAEKVISKIYDALDLLATQPGMGHRREDVTDADVRFWPVFSYLIVYREQEPLTVVRVWGGRQDPASLKESLDRDQ